MRKTKRLPVKATPVAIALEEPFSDASIADVFFDDLYNILGGKALNSKIKNEFDLIQQAESGIKMKSVKAVSEFLDISMDKMSQLLNVSIRTFQRKKATDVMSAAISQKTIDIAEVAAKGKEIFGNKEKFNLWLNSPIPALHNRKPFDLLKTSTGIKLVMTTLMRIEYGIYI
ncbi:MAG: DUF2384 domain-containing protein [Bacteroidetes bacterium]|nr:DUF2384 domain-containing protein [Bacteroidota bacterium]